MENQNEIIIIDTTSKQPLKKFFLTAIVHKSITYRNQKTNNKIKGPYIFDDQFVPVEFIKTVKTKYIENNNECPICLEIIKIKDMIETNCHHLYCDKCFFSILHLCEKKCALCRSQQNDWIISSIKVEKVDFIDGYEITD